MRFFLYIRTRPPKTALNSFALKRKKKLIVYAYTVFSRKETRSAYGFAANAFLHSNQIFAFLYSALVV